MNDAKRADALALLAQARPAGLDRPSDPERRARDVQAATRSAAQAPSERPGSGQVPGPGQVPGSGQVPGPGQVPGHGDRPPRRRRYTIGVPLTAGAAAAVVIAAMTAGGGAAPPRHAGALHTHHAHVKTQDSALAVLTRAASAAAAASAPTTGRYWLVEYQNLTLQAAGTAAHPYNIATRLNQAYWTARQSGGKSWMFTRDSGTGPAAAQDIAAWRALGAPTSWHFGSLQYGYNEQTFSTRGAAPYWVWQTQAHDTVGDELTWGTKTYLLRADPASLQATLVKIARSQDDDAFTIGVTALAQDPLSPQVRAGLFQALAALPGVHTTGVIKDPLGRSGYGIAGREGAGMTLVAVVSPSTGKVLALEQVLATPGTSVTKTFTSECRNLTQLRLTPAQRAALERRIGGLCRRLAKDGTRYVQYGTRYQGQVVGYWAYTRATWTNDAPTPSGTQFGPGHGVG